MSAIAVQIVGFIIGTKGTKKVAIEQDTGAHISIVSKSRKPAEQASIVIKGTNKNIVENAAHRVTSAIREAMASNR